MSAPDSAGAAFNPAVRTEDNVPEPDTDAEHDNTDEADDGLTTGEDPA